MAVDLFGNETDTVDSLYPDDTTYRGGLDREKGLSVVAPPPTGGGLYPPTPDARPLPLRDVSTGSGGGTSSRGPNYSSTYPGGIENPLISPDEQQRRTQKADNYWQDVQTYAKEQGNGYNLDISSYLDDLYRHAAYDSEDLDSVLAGRKQDIRERLASERTGNRNDDGPSSLSSRPNYNLPGSQFDDAYTSLLERIAKSQMGEVRSNPGLDSLMNFLTQRFTELSTNPGYSPAELATLNTQALEPIEARRKAAQDAELLRTSRAGYAPTSGITLDQQRLIDTEADRQRTAAGRDLAVTALNRRDQNLSQALDLGTRLGLTIPGAQRSEELSLGNLLYQLPRNALTDALSVINGSPSPQDAVSSAIQLAAQNRYQSSIDATQNAAVWGQIGQILASLFK